MIDPQIMHLLETFGPIVLAAVGTILTAVFGAIAGVARYAWKIHQRRMETMAETLGSLAKAVVVAQEKSEVENRKLWDATQGTRAEIALAHRGSQDALARVLELGGMIRLQQEAMEKNTRSMERLSGKMEAVFRFIDAPRRATDKA